MTCGPLSSIVSTIENLVKTQMQLDSVTHKRSRNSFDCLSEILSQRRFALLYTGHSVNTAREMAFLASYFHVYEGLRATFLTLLAPRESQNQHNVQRYAVPVAGGFAGAIAWFFSFPLDCVRARVQGQRLGHKDKSRSAVSVFRDLMRSQGLRGLYSGVTPSIFRAFLVSGSRFSAYELALYLLRGGRDVHY